MAKHFFINKLLIIIGLSLLSNLVVVGQEKNDTWTYEDDKYQLVFKFDEEGFMVDTFKTYCGQIYTISFSKDSSYIRINYLMGGTFECCNKNQIYKETFAEKDSMLIDRGGIRLDNSLIWRSIQNRDLEVVYNNSSNERAVSLDRIFNKLIIQLKEAK